MFEFKKNCEGCGTKENLCYYSEGTFCPECREKQVQQWIKNYKWDRYKTMFTPLAICPYCGYEENDSFELDDGEHICGRCGREYIVERHIEVTYSTTRI